MASGCTRFGVGSAFVTGFLGGLAARDSNADNLGGAAAEIAWKGAFGAIAGVVTYGLSCAMTKVVETNYCTRAFRAVCLGASSAAATDAFENRAAPGFKKIILGGLAGGVIWIATECMRPFDTAVEEEIVDRDIEVSMPVLQHRIIRSYQTSIPASKKEPSFKSKRQDYIRLNLYAFTTHAQERKVERDISEYDILHVLKTGWHEQDKSSFKEEHQRWSYAVRGKTHFGDDLRVIVTFKNNIMLIVTAIKL